MKKKLLILSDSMTLPRNQNGDFLLYEDTWPSLLQLDVENIDIMRVGIGSATTDDILYQCRYWTNLKPDYVVIQAGVCDALPRVLHGYELDIIKRLPFSGKIQKLISRHGPCIRRVRKIQKVTKKQFMKNIKKIKEIFPDLYWIGIICHDGVHERLPFAEKYITKYNSILKEIVGLRFIDVSDFHEKYIMGDKFHLNSDGNQVLATRIQETLKIK
jgi:lysophospholipase L1-like esterase